MLHNNINITPLTFFCSDDRPNGRVTEYLLYHNNQLVYRGEDRQHGITGKKEEQSVCTHACACCCVCVCVCTVAVEGCGPGCKEWSEEKQHRERGGVGVVVGGGLAFERGKSIPVFARGIAL